MTSLRDNPANPRWLRKTLREIPREIGRVIERFDEAGLRWRPAADEWCALEVLGFLRESEREDLEAIEAIIRYDGAPIAEQRAHLAPGEHDFTSHSAWRLLEDFLEQRESVLWSLELVDDDEWTHAGVHPYRGSITLARYAREMSDRDMEASLMLRRLDNAVGREPAGSAGGDGRRRRR